LGFGRQDNFLHTALKKIKGNLLPCHFFPPKKLLQKSLKRKLKALLLFFWINGKNTEHDEKKMGKNGKWGLLSCILLSRRSLHRLGMPRFASLSLSRKRGIARL
jgi:hypothetical protein